MENIIYRSKFQKQFHKPDTQTRQWTGPNLLHSLSQTPDPTSHHRWLWFCTRSWRTNRDVSPGTPARLALAPAQVLYLEEIS